MIVARQTDEATNTSEESAGITITIDATAPSAPTIAGITDGSTYETATFTVSGEPGATIEYSTDDGSTWQTYPSEVTIDTVGSYTVVARQTDAAGNVSPVTSGIAITISSAAWAQLGSALATSGAPENVQIALASDDTPYVAAVEDNTLEIFKYESSAWSQVGGADANDSSVTDLDLYLSQWDGSAFTKLSGDKTTAEVASYFSFRQPFDTKRRKVQIFFQLLLLFKRCTYFVSKFQ